MKPGKIAALHFSNAVVFGGAEQHIVSLLQALDRQRFRLHLVSMPELAAVFRERLPVEIEVIPLRLSSPAHVINAARFCRCLRRRRIDLVHSHLFRASLLASPLARLAGVPVTVETSHVRESWRRGVKSYFWVDRIASAFVDRYIAVSQANGRYLLKDKRLPAHKIRVVRNGCVLTSPHDAWTRRSELRQQLGFTEHDPVLVVVGRLEPQKGHRVLLHALTELCKRVPNIRLVCVGQGSLRQDLEELTRQLGLADIVHWVGQQADASSWLSMGDLTALPSYYEGLPLVAIESLNCERPLVATAVDGTPEVVVDGKHGILVLPGDPSALAEAIYSLLDNSERRIQMGKEGARWVRENFTVERQARQTERVYIEALRQAGCAIESPPSADSVAPPPPALQEVK